MVSLLDLGYKKYNIREECHVGEHDENGLSVHIHGVKYGAQVAMGLTI